MQLMVGDVGVGVSMCIQDRYTTVVYCNYPTVDLNNRKKPEKAACIIHSWNLFEKELKIFAQNSNF
jgi:hypothetical protein